MRDLPTPRCCAERATPAATLPLKGSAAQGWLLEAARWGRRSCRPVAQREEGEAEQDDGASAEKRQLFGGPQAIEVPQAEDLNRQGAGGQEDAGGDDEQAKLSFG